MDCCGTAILPLLLAAQEAWMSINRLQADHGPLAVLLAAGGHGWAVAADP